MTTTPESTPRVIDECSDSGTPARGSAEIGERILDVLGGHAAQAVTELLDARLSNRLLGFRDAIA